MNAPADRVLDRDSFTEQYVGKPVYRLAQVERAAEALRDLGNADAFLVVAKVPTTAVATTARLTALGFQIIDAGVQLDAAAGAIRATGGPDLAPELRVRAAIPADRPAVERVAAANLVTSRFHLDPQIEPASASALKRDWTGNFFDGRRGDRLLVTERNGEVGGFLLVLEHAEVGTIDLIALDPSLRGSGAFAALVHAWLDAAPAIERVVVGTQISNVRSLRAYGRLGFRVCGTAYVLHLHGGTQGGGGVGS